MGTLANPAAVLFDFGSIQLARGSSYRESIVADKMYNLFYIPKIICGHIASHPDSLTGRIVCALLTDATLAWVGDASSVLTLVVVATERFTVPSCVPLGSAGNLQCAN